MDILTYEDDNINLGKTAVALGKFQGLHKGHMLLIDQVVSLARKENLTGVVFTINTNDGRKIFLPEERHEILKNAGVDVALECEFSESFARLEPEEFIKEILKKKLHAAYVVVGKDFKFGFNRAGDVDRLREYGLKYDFEVVAFDKLCVADTVISTSYIRELIGEGRMDAVPDFMGRDYFISGVVQTGKQLGRTIGFPTINMVPDKKKLLPPFGVYETGINICGKAYRGITNVGNNPTVEDGKDVFVETNILDFSGNLYGERLKVEFKRFLRREKKFKNIDELKKQLSRDRERLSDET